MAPIAQSGPFRAPKRCFLARNHFFVSSLKKIVTIIAGHLKDNLFVLTALQGGLGAQWANLGLQVVKLNQYLYLLYFWRHHPKMLIPS